MFIYIRQKINYKLLVSCIYFLNVKVIVLKCNYHNYKTNSPIQNIVIIICSAQFILALLAHSFNCAKISSALNVYIVYVQKT